METQDRFLARRRTVSVQQSLQRGWGSNSKLARRHTARENLLISGSRAGSMNNLRPERSGGEDPGCADSVGHDCPSLKETRKLSTSRAMEPAHKVHRTETSSRVAITPQLLN